MNMLLFQIVCVLLVAIIPSIIMWSFAQIIIPEKFYNKRNINWATYLCDILICSSYLWLFFYNVKIFQKYIIEKSTEVFITMPMIVSWVIIISVITIYGIVIAVKYWNKIPNKKIN